MTSPARFPSELWPLFLLAHQGEDACKGVPLMDLLCPPTPDALRAAYRPVFAQMDLTACTGLDASEDAELAHWVTVLRGPLLTGQPGELLTLPASLTTDGEMLTHLTRLLTLPLYERMDVFMAAMRQKGAA